MNSDESHRTHHDIQITRRWTVFSAILFAVQALVLSILADSYLGVGLTEGWMLAVNTSIIVLVSVFMGQFWEYALRRRQSEVSE